MKMLVNMLFIVSACTLPVVSSAQSTTSATRAQVKADLSQLEAAGYDIAGSDLDYPDNLKSAEAGLAAQQERKSRATQSGYGSTSNGTSSSGAR